MGLYLCVFDGDVELDGVEVGFYEDFATLRGAVGEQLEGGERGTRFPVLMLHSDCDGEWGTDECAMLQNELRDIRDQFRGRPPIELAQGWKTQIATEMRLSPQSLADCFFDVNGEPLLDRLIALCDVALKADRPILFQ